MALRDPALGRQPHEQARVLQRVSCARCSAPAHWSSRSSAARSATPSTRSVAGGDGWLRQRKPYLEPNAWRAYEVDGRKRLLPEFEEVRLDKLDTEYVRAWMAEQAETVEAGEIAAKTINNTLGTWSSA